VIGSKIRGGQTIRNLFWEQVTLPRLAIKHKIDILHSPANMAPLYYPRKSIIHIHDLCFVVNPQWYSFAFRTWYNLVIPRIANKASKIVTNSNNSRNDLLQFCRLPVDKISLVYWAVDQRFEAAINGSAKRPNIPSDYILYVGSLEPRKNIRTLVEAYKQFRSKSRDLNIKLVLVGGESPLFAEMSFDSDRYEADIIVKGFVNEAELLNYYRFASLVAYPSLYEGFGLPPLEAMAAGTPVVTSNTSSLPEVVGDAAIMVDPLNTTELADAMERILRDPELRRTLIEKGYQQVRRFNWYRVARNVLAVYYEVYNASDGPCTDQVYVPFAFWKKLVKLEQQRLSDELDTPPALI
jgi:glycosyltransferase involved in cell wall biosynthesis